MFFFLFYFLGHIRFRALSITIESIFSIVIFLEILSLGWFPADFLVFDEATLICANDENFLTGTEFDPDQQD